MLHLKYKEKYTVTPPLCVEPLCCCYYGTALDIYQAYCPAHHLGNNPIVCPITLVFARPITHPVAWSVVWSPAQFHMDATRQEDPAQQKRIQDRQF